MHAPRVLSIVWNLIRGGTEGQCARVAMGLAARGYTPRVATFRREGFFLEPLEARCGRTYDFDIRRLASLHTVAEIARLGRWIRRERIDIVHAWDADAAIFGAVAAALARVPLITSRRDLGEIYPAYKLRLMRLADRRAKAVVVNAQAIQEALARDGLDARKVVIIPNLLDIEEFDRLAKDGTSPLQVASGERVVGMVARLDPEKDGATFLHAAAQVLATHSRVRFVIAGDGPDRPGLETLADALGIAEQVAFLGEVTDVPNLVSCFDVGVLVARANEGLSNTILEYMAAGKPSVVTDCGGNRELVHEGENGFVVPIGDSEVMAAAIRRLLDDRSLALRMGESARSRIERNHAPEAVLDRFEQLYCQVAARP